MRSAVLCAMAATLWLSGCAPKTAPATLAERLKDVDAGVRPVLPSPAAASYARNASVPNDRVLAVMMEGRRWETTLSAAASALALDALDGVGNLTRWELREAMWRGGYAYPARGAQIWNTEAGAQPPRELLEWLEALPEGADIGLVRARKGNADAWVGIWATPQINLKVQPRSTTTGSPLTLPAVPGGRFVVSDPTGKLFDGPLDAGQTLLLTRSGEWLVLVLKGDREVARYPVYVDVPLPNTPLLRGLEGAPSLATDFDAQQRLNTLLSQVRKAYDLEAWKVSPRMDMAAREIAAGRSTVEAAQVAGLTQSALVTWRCDDVSVENCLDRWIWDPRSRKIVLDPTYAQSGAEVHMDPLGVHATLVLSAAP